MERVIGIDIGGANTKVCLVEKDKGYLSCVNGGSIYHEVWRNPQGLRQVLTSFKNTLSLDKIEDTLEVALTMTAELCDVFSSKEEGVVFLVQLVQEVFPRIPIYVWTTKGVFLRPEEIKKAPLEAAAANWLASATALAHSPLFSYEGAILADMGSTTTDILPVAKGAVQVRGKTDMERLLSGELIYTGLLRTSIAGLTDCFYVDGVPCRVVNEYFSVTGDVYRILGRLTEEEYDFPAPDGGSRDLPGCAKRIARMVSAEPEDLGWEKICSMARYIQEKQIQKIVESILRIISRKEIAQPQLLITTGQGSFILEEAARRLLWKTIPWYRMMPGAGPEHAMTAYGVAWLLLNREIN